MAIVHADQRLLCERNASQQGQPQISLHEELRPQPGQQQEPPGQQGPLCSDQQPGASLPPELAGPTVPGQGSSAHQAADAPRLVSCLLNMGLLDVLASVLAVACRQLQQDMPGADSRGSPAQAPQTIPSSSGHAEGHAGVGDVHSPSAGEGALATPEAAVDEDALDAALRMLEELAAAPEGRAALMQGAAAAVGDALLARGGQLPVIHSVQPVPAQAPQRDCPSAATQLPSLLLRLLMLSDSPQVHIMGWIFGFAQDWLLQGRPCVMAYGNAGHLPVV